jgi:hypothetical protein
MTPPRRETLPGLAAALEARLVGDPSSPALDGLFGSVIPEKDSYVLVVFDGLGAAQLDHPDAAPLRDSLAAVIDSPFPTTTSVALASVATAMTPSEHGLTAHLLWVPEFGRVVNTLKWVDLSGGLVEHDYASVLPRPNMWERLAAAGVEPITVQPSAFEASPLSRLLYRGARFEGAWDESDLARATIQLAASPRRLIFTYHWQVDFAGHVHGLGSPEFSEAMRGAGRLWEELSNGLPDSVGLIGTADHGLIEYPDEDKIVVRDERYDSLRFGGDPRGIQLWGGSGLIDDFAASTGGTSVDPAELFGTRLADGPDRVVLAPPGKVLLPPGFDKRLKAYHGGLEPAEREIPLLVRGGATNKES